MKLKKCIFLLLLIFILLLAASCKYTAGEDTYYVSREMENEADKITLRFISSWGGVDSKAETLQSLFVKYTNENRNIEIINESLFGEDFLPKIKTDFASGNSPDVFGLWPGSDIRALIKVGKVADLTDLLNENPEWKNSFKSSMWVYTTYNDRIYGLPFETIFEALFINKDLFEQYNAPVPETFDDLKRAVRIFRENGIIPIAYNSLAEGTYLYQNILAVLAGKENIENPSAGEAGEYFKKAMECMRELYKMGAFPEECFTMTNHERNLLFQQKKAAMIVQGSWFIGNIKDTDDTVDIVHFPHIDGGKAPPRTMIYGIGNGCFHISSEAYNSDKREACIDLLKMLTSKETAVIFAEQTGMISTVDIRDYKINYNSLTRKGQLLLNNSRQFVGPPDSFVDRTVWEQVIAADMPYMLEGEMEIDELWDKAVSAGLIAK
jgi:raffinose/stachyose/melibiose transport system substrate-binding protein